MPERKVVTTVGIDGERIQQYLVGTVPILSHMRGQCQVLYEKKAWVAK